MKLCKVIGTIVSTNKDEKLVGRKLQMVQPLNLKTLEPEGETLAAVDTVGAGEGEIVLIVTGSSARQTNTTKDTPVDTAIVAIVDTLEVDDTTRYTSNR